MLDLHMRLTAQVQPDKSSSKKCGRPTRDLDCVFVFFVFLTFLVTGSQAGQCFLYVFGVSGNQQPNRSVFLCFWCF